MSVARIKGAVQSLAPGREPPAELQLWSVGANATDYGVHVWSDRSAREVLKRYAARGNPLLLDVEHNGATLKDGEPAVTAGYARLEVRAGAPWLVFEWSDYGREQIATGQRRFVSPEYDVDENTGEILALYRVSLVADPGTHRARMLAAANNGVTMDLQVILAALRAALAAEDPAVTKESISNLLAELSKGSGESEPTTETATGQDPVDEPPAPVAAATGGEPEKPEKPEPVAASAKPAPAPTPAPVTASIPAPTAPSVSAAAGAAVQQIRAAQRDHLIATQGDRLDPSIRRWASAQPLEVVEGLLAATPAKVEGRQRAAATRGATQGAAPPAQGLQGRDLEEFQKAMGTFKASAPVVPHEENDGRKLVLPSTPPSVYRASLAGKAGK